MGESLGGARAVEFQDAAPRGDGDDARGAEFDGFLDRQIHLVARLQRLHQRHADRRLALDGLPIEHVCGHPVALDSGNPRLAFAAIAFEQDNIVTDAQAKNARRMARGSLG